jgi:tRNA dimethylallyltransferase
LKNKTKVLAIIGPTASGKTALSVRLAEKLSEHTGKEIEIISADSRQVYKHIPIATAQPSIDIQKRFKHHFVNELELEQEFNAGEFGRKGREVIRNIFDSGKIPIIAGGSGLYIDSLVNGLFDYEDFKEDEDFKLSRNKIRNELYIELKNYGLEKLVTELKKADPVTFNSMPQKTERRVIRALEVYYLTGIPISTHKNKKIDIGFKAVLMGIDMDRIELYGRINKRVENMIVDGLVEEIRKLKEMGFHYRDYNSLNTVGVKEVFDWLDEKLSYEKMVGLIKQNTRRFAKRQITWFKRYKDIKWIDSNSEIATWISGEFSIQELI